jgi:hypothetical protein
LSSISGFTFAYTTAKYVKFALYDLKYNSETNNIDLVVRKSGDFSDDLRNLEISVFTVIDPCVSELCRQVIKNPSSDTGKSSGNLFTQPENLFTLNYNIPNQQQN